MFNQDTFNGKNLSQIASEIWQEHQAAQFGFEECSAFGCPEAGELVANHMANAIDEILADAGLTREQFNELVEDRTSPRWAYFNGLQVFPY